MDLDTLANISDVVSIPIAIVGLILVLHQLYLTRIESEKEHLRTKNEMTLNAYTSIRKDLRIITSRIRKELDIDDRFKQLTQEHISIIMQNKSLGHDISEMLSMLNKFAVGVRHDIFNIEILNELSGEYFIKTHEQFVPYIQLVRADSYDLYSEYDILVNRLTQMSINKKSLLSKKEIQPTLKNSIKVDRWALLFGAIVITETYIYSIGQHLTLVNKFIITLLIFMILGIIIQLYYAVIKYFSLVHRIKT